MNRLSSNEKLAHSAGHFEFIFAGQLTEYYLPRSTIPTKYRPAFHSKTNFNENTNNDFPLNCELGGEFQTSSA